MAVHTSNQAAPARQWVAVTPSDTVNLPAGCRGLFANGAGDIAAVGADGIVAVFTVGASQIVPIGPVRINATDTTASDIIALY